MYIVQLGNHLSCLCALYLGI